MFKKGNKADQGNYRGIKVLSTGGKTFCTILNDKNGNDDGAGRKNKRRAGRVCAKP